MNERVGWFLFGMAVGFVFGLIVARLRAIEEKVESVDKHILHEQELLEEDLRQHRKDERGALNLNSQTLLYFIVMLIVVWSVIASTRSSNEVEKAQDHIDQIARCNSVYLSSFLDAVEPRTNSGQKQAADNVHLQAAWYSFVQFQLQVPPHPEAEQRAKANVYASALKEFLKSAEKSKTEVHQNPYPTAEQLNKCIKSEGTAK